MEILELHHVSLPTRDLERSRTFYRDVLGLAEIQRPPFPFPGAWFRLGDRELHLIGEAEDAQGGSGTDPNQLHFAIRVARFGEMVEGLKRLGFREEAQLGDPMHLVVRLRPVTGYPQAYLTDPDRHLIEINAADADS